MKRMILIALSLISINVIAQSTQSIHKEVVGGIAKRLIETYSYEHEDAGVIDDGYMIRLSIPDDIKETERVKKQVAQMMPVRREMLIDWERDEKHLLPREIAVWDLYFITNNNADVIDTHVAVMIEEWDGEPIQVSIRIAKKLVEIRY